MGGGSSGAVRAATRDVVAEAFVDNPDRKLKPGMFADVLLDIGKQKQAAIPENAIFERQEKKRVYVIADGRLEERVLQLGAKVEHLVAVQHGIKPGDKVAVGDLSALTNGARVE